MNSMSYSSVLIQSHNKNKRSYNNPRQQQAPRNGTQVSQLRCRQRNISDSIRRSMYCHLNGVTYETEKQQRSKPRYPMWGNSVLLDKPNGTHCSSMNHSHLLDVYQRLHAMIQRLEPKLAHVISPIIAKNMNENEMQNMLLCTASLKGRIAKEVALLSNSKAVNKARQKPIGLDLYHKIIDSKNRHSRSRYKPTNIRPAASNYLQKHSANGCTHNQRNKSYKSACKSHINRASKHENRVKKRPSSKLNVVYRRKTHEINQNEQKESSAKRVLSLNNRDHDAMMNNAYRSAMEMDDDEEYDGLPDICSIQVLRVIVNCMIPKQIFELLLERLCIKKAKGTKKIFVRCHKSHFHSNSTVIYIHFVNFEEDEYRGIRDTYFDFVDANQKRIGWFRGRFNHNKKIKKQKRHIFDIMGNELDLIEIQAVKEYDAFTTNINYLSRIVNICLRCKINKASARRRVCSFCINDVRDDRTKIIHYYHNSLNNVAHKSTEQIQKDLINKLKIELHLIPLTFERGCNKIDVKTNKCSSNMCSFVHTNDDRIFGQQLSQIRSNAIKQQYAGNGEYDINNYETVRIQLKYRHIIGKYCNVWKNNEINIGLDPSLSMDIIRKHLTDKDIKLYLIPTVYKNWCYYAKDKPNERLCSKRSKRVCTFIHDDDEKMFGDLLWKIKYESVQERANNELEGSETSVNLTDDEASVDSDDIKAIDPKDKWWRETITPYIDANSDEYEAEKELVEKWTMNDAIIYITTQQINYNEDKNIYHSLQLQEYIKCDKTSSHSLFVEFDDTKSAKIRTMRTYARFTFKCSYNIEFNVVNYEENMRMQLEECDLVKQFMNDCVSIADYLRITHHKIYKHFRSRIHIGSIIAAFAVTPDKNREDCAACYFNVCDGIKHKLLYGNEAQLQRECCDNDLEKVREHKFDTRKCDTLHGVIVSMQRRNNLKMEQDGKIRYKALILANKNNPETYLKFLIIGSNKLNTAKQQRHFKDILVNYPCNTHQYKRIKEKLELLEQYSICREHEITQIIFGFNGIKPRNLYCKQRMNKKQISELFGGKHALNQSQINAVHGAIHHNMYTIQGPPATGKTATCAHIAYLWWMLEEEEGKPNIKIHAMTPTNKGTLLLAMKCHEMNEMMRDKPNITANTVCDGFIREFGGTNIPGSIRDLCLRFYYVNNNENKRKNDNKPLKVLYFASKTYSNILENKNALKKQKKSSGVMHMTEEEKVCVNLAAEYHLKLLSGYKKMSVKEKDGWKSQYIIRELRSADIICTTFGNSCHRHIADLFVDDFTHAIADECNQSSLDTFLGIIGYPNMRHLTLAGDIRQLSPVAMAQNKLCHTSIYEQIVRYLTDSSFEPNQYYTRLNEQYRSHPQIYAITSNIFYNGTVKDNIYMQYKREYKSNKRNLNYSLLFANKSNHIQFHMLTNSQKQLDSKRHSKYNVSEARIAIKYIKRFVLDLGYREDEIAVISDYAAQIDCVYSYLKRIKKINADKILLCTTNEIEGSSKPIVIYMCCRSNNTGNIGFLNDITRINVATSRAQFGQIIIGDIYTLQYNPIYRQIFNFHQKHGAVVYGKNIDKLTIVNECIPLINVSLKHFFMKQKKSQMNSKRLHLDYYVCGGCNRNIYCKLFCGRIICAPPIFIYICHKCISRYLTQLCDSYINNRFSSKFSAVSAMTIVQKTDLNISDSFGISLEFDLLLSRYLVKYGLTKFSNSDLDQTEKNKMSRLYLKFIEIVKEIVNVCSIKNKTKHIPHCFKVLSEFDVIRGKTDEIRSDSNRNKAIGIMQCIRNHLLRQSIIDSRFFRLVYEIKNCKASLQQFYTKHKYTFYKYVGFELHQPTFIVIAYLKACGYSTNIANHLHRKIGKLLFDKNLNKASRNTAAIQLDDTEIISLAQYLKLDAFTGINNVLLSSHTAADSNALSGRYVIKLMQNAVINDPMSSYYDLRTYKTAIAKEASFGDDLRAAGFDYYSEKELQDLGYKDTPDYYLKKPWIVYYNDNKCEITWIDFKYSYCSATQWNIDKLRFQATRYNQTFGPGAFVFSLGCVQIPKQLQINAHGLIAALPLTKDTILKFIRLHTSANKK